MVYPARVSGGPSRVSKVLAYQTALVLGGGGAHGRIKSVFGKHCKNRGITFEWITGTSVGALNGVLILMNDVEAAVDLWANISNEQVLHYPLASVRAQTLRDLMNQANSLVREAVKATVPVPNPWQSFCKRPLIKKIQPNCLSFADLYDSSARFQGRRFMPFDPSAVGNPLVVGIRFILSSDAGARLTTLITSMAAIATTCPSMSLSSKGQRNVSPWMSKDLASIKGRFVTEETAQLSLGSPWTLGSFLVLMPSVRWII